MASSLEVKRHLDQVLGMYSTVTSTINYIYVLTDINQWYKVEDALIRCGFSVVNWYKLGQRLGLKKTTLDIIEKNFPDNVDRCMTECLDKWLRRADEVTPTWKSLCDALKAMNEPAVVSHLQST